MQRHVITVPTGAPIALVDLSDAVREWVRMQVEATPALAQGSLLVSTPHTTARIAINERDPALQRDMQAFLERLAPRDAAYEHNAHTVDGRDNAHAHLLALLMPATETIPVVDGALALGTWQALFFVELDGPRERREVHLQLQSA